MTWAAVAIGEVRCRGSPRHRPRRRRRRPDQRRQRGSPGPIVTALIYFFRVAS
jgi:hypothetical protein